MKDNVYAKLKALCEKNLIRNLGENVKPCILRLGTVYGASDRPRYDLVINLFSGLAANKKTITINGGNQWRPFIHVKDVADSILKIIKSKKEKVNGQILNLVGENIQISTIGRIIKRIYPMTKIKYEYNITDHRDYKSSNKKAKKIINFKVKHKITDEEIEKQMAAFSSDEDSDENFIDEEPLLKYRRLKSSVTEILSGGKTTQPDSASCLSFHRSFMVLGTRSGALYISVTLKKSIPPIHVTASSELLNPLLSVIIQ